MPPRKFKTSGDCRRYLANVINRVEAGTLDALIASKLGYLVTIIVKIIEVNDLEARIRRLEETIK